MKKRKLVDLIIFKHLNKQHMGYITDNYSDMIGIICLSTNRYLEINKNIVKNTIISRATPI